MNVHIRWMIRRDLPTVLAIESECYANPWDESDFVRCLRERNVVGMVAEPTDETIAGFFLYELHKTRLHLLNLAVRPSFHRQGVGASMLRRLAGKLDQQRRSRITLHVRETNLAAQLFFKAQGFKAVDIVRGQYDDTNEDGYVFSYRASEAAIV